MIDSPPKFAVDGLSNEELLKELCQKVEFVAVGGWALPNNPTLEFAIGHIQAIYSELERQGVDCRHRVAQLGEQRHWQMQRFFDDCLAFPECVPYVREADGIRRLLRCRMCQAAEHPPDARILKFCDRCMQRVLAAICQGRACETLFIFRTYSPAHRCVHASAETVLACEACTDNIVGVCEKCIRDEIERRRKAA